MKAVMLAAGAAFVACSSSSGSTPDTADWMSHQADGASLARLTLPGTHDTMAMFVQIVAKTQSMMLADQYTNGVRYVDMRCRNANDGFEMYHGIIDQNATFDDVLATTYAFLDAHPTETIVMSVKEETGSDTTNETFDQVAADYIAKGSGYWYTGDADPLLGAVRGKIVLLRRYATATTPMGIDGSMWADNTTFTLVTPDATLRIEDNYISVDPATDKWPAITALFDEARMGSAADHDQTWDLTYTSAYVTGSGGLPDINEVSDVINPLLDTYFADPANAGAHLGTLAMDFVTAERLAAVVALNPQLQ